MDNLVERLNEAERKQLALLSFFREFVDVDWLLLMGNVEAGSWALPELRGLDYRSGTALLDRIAKAGFLKIMPGSKYQILPPGSKLFSTLFQDYYAGSNQQAARAFVGGMSIVARIYQDMLHDASPSLTHALRLSVSYGWYDVFAELKDALQSFHQKTGRMDEWRRIALEIEPEPRSDWKEVVDTVLPQYVEHRREAARHALSIPSDVLTDEDRQTIVKLAEVLRDHGLLLLAKGDAQCARVLLESYDLFDRIRGHTGARSAACELGNSYLQVPEILNLERAGRWYRRSLELCTANDAHLRAKILSQLGAVAYERYDAARKARDSQAELTRHLEDSLQLSREALVLLPFDDFAGLASTHNQLGLIFDAMASWDLALDHYKKTEHCYEMLDDVANVASTKRNMAIAYAQARRFVEADSCAEDACNLYIRLGDQFQIDRTLKVRTLIKREKDRDGK